MKYRKIRGHFGADIAQSVQQPATGWTVRGSNPGGGEIFRTCPDQLWDPPSLPNNEYRVFPRSKAAGVWRWPPTPSSAEVKKRVKLYLYSPCGPPWSDVGGPSLLSFSGYFTWSNVCVLAESCYYGPHLCGFPHCQFDTVRCQFPPINAHNVAFIKIRNWHARNVYINRINGKISSVWSER